MERKEQVASQEVRRPFEKKQTMELKFKHVTFSVTTRSWRKPFFAKKEILHGVSGELLPGQLTAIMGPSGAGKSTLLNVLAGYKVQGASGQIFVNGQERNVGRLRSFLRQSCYIQQDSYLRGNLTVQESMMVAAELKLGRLVSQIGKQQKVHELLGMLGLSTSLNTLADRLSGGQKKRLSLALELLTNPPIIFLDEPTTGLDSLSSSQCVAILKMLAREGRTVIATIHQPSALIFEMFDSLYAVAGGHCLYSGRVKDLVPYLASCGFPCPLYHNPSDYLIEVAVGEHGPMDSLITREDAPREKKKMEAIKFGANIMEDFKESLKTRKIFSASETGASPNITEHVPQPNSLILEFYYLYMRNLITLQRTFKTRIVVFLSHFLCGLMLGSTFYGVGNNASMARENLAFVFALLLFIIFVGLMSVLVTLPNDLKCLTAEHFNQWYSLFPYYVSIISIEIPIQTLNCILAFPLIYYLADQPLEYFRYFLFNLFVIITALTAQAHGFLLGAGVDMRLALFGGPVFSCILAIFGFTLRMCDTPMIFQLASLLSYVRSSFSSIAYVLYGFGREPLACEEELYCHFRVPNKLLKEMDMETINVYGNLTYMIGLIAFIHLFTYFILYKRLRLR